MAYVYWHHLPDMKNNTSLGYIGVTKHSIEERYKQHLYAAEKGSLLPFHRAIRQYKSSIKTKTILIDTEENCYNEEYNLRPDPYIGWNAAVGGGSIYTGWQPGKNWLSNRVWHPTHGEYVINENFTSTSLQSLFLKHKSLGSVRGGLSRLLNGKNSAYNEWEFADAQLANRIKTYRSQVWDKIYIQRIDNSNHIVLINRERASLFYKDYNTNAGASSLKNLWTGAQTKCNGWIKSNRNKWLTTKRLEY